VSPAMLILIPAVAVVAVLCALVARELAQGG
jgi:hypothetical protein